MVMRLSEEKYGFALIGAGFAGELHAKALRSLLPHEPLYVLSRQGKTAHALAEATKAIAVDTFECFPQTLRGAIIATPPQTYRPIVEKCIARGWHLLIEKPLALSSSEGESFVKKAQENDLKIVVGCVLRSNPAHQVMKQLLLSGVMGKLLSWSDERLAKRLSAERQWWNGVSTGLLGFQGTHSLDLLLWTLGRGCSIQKASFGDKVLATGWQDFSLEMTHKKCKKIHIRHSLSSDVLRNKLTITGAKGELTVTDFCKVSLNAKAVYEGKDFLATAYREQLSKFISVTRGHNEVDLCSGKEGISSLRLIDAAIASYKGKYNEKCQYC
jgi:predicted dehydrogenase